VNQPFIKGLELCRSFYQVAVKPLLDSHFPGLTYSAALIGPGSDVLGFDTPQSRDHDWGPRLLLFLTRADHAGCRDEIDRRLRQELPATVCGYPTNFTLYEDGVAAMAPSDGGPINHRVQLLTVRPFFTSSLNFDPEGDIGAVDWLGAPEQRLLEVTTGGIFHDGLGRLEPIRARLRYYPTDVWLYRLAAQWRRIAQERAFMGRCGQVGDELGSRLVAARVVRDLMRLCFLMERRYAPYIKWLGSAFAQLDCGPDLAPVLARVLATGGWEERQTHLSNAYEYVARMHNALDITAPLPTQVSQFYERPFQVIQADNFADALRAAIKDEVILGLPEHLGSVDQFIDATDAWAVLDRLRLVYGLPEAPI
jgi:hypothetical protein